MHAEHRVAEGAGQAEARRLRAQAEDVLLKLTRLLANLAIHPGAGRALASNPHVVGLLLATLGKTPLPGPAHGVGATPRRCWGWGCPGLRGEPAHPARPWGLVAL